MRGLLPDRLGDWRVESVAETAGENRTPDGKPIAPGTRVEKISIVEDDIQGRLVFPTPSPPALALSAALARASAAKRLRSAIRFDKPSKPDGWSINDADVGRLFEMFEESMEAVVLSFMALELFANRIIDLHAPDRLTLPRVQNGKRKERELTKTRWNAT